MRGFTDSTQPVFLNLDPLVTTVLGIAANTAIAIDGAQAEANDYGILCNVSGTRYFFPWSKVYMIRQVQPVPPAAPAATVQAPPASTPPKGD